MPDIQFSRFVTEEMVATREPIVLQITKEMVESKDTAPIENASAIMREMEVYQTLIPAFAYDSDPRELFEIPEVCEYVKLMFERVPEMLILMPAAVETYRPLILCMIGAVVVGKRFGTAQIGIQSLPNARSIIRELIWVTEKRAKELGKWSLMSKVKRAIDRIGLM